MCKETQFITIITNKREVLTCNHQANLHLHTCFNTCTQAALETCVRSEECFKIKNNDSTDVYTAA